MNILVVNQHVPYIYMLAKTGHTIWVINPEGRVWDTRMRPIPNNVIVVMGAKGQMMLRQNIDKIDRVICNDAFAEGGLYDLTVTQDLQVPKILLFHNSSGVHFGDRYAEVKPKMQEGLKGIKKVFISEFKKKSWGMDGVVIKPGIDLEEFGGWTGNGGFVLTCLNNAMHRDFMNGTIDTQLATCDIKFVLLGEENGQGQFSTSFDEYKQGLRNARWYMALNREKFEDGYNLSMLEAMATGCPALTLDHPTSPIKNGYNGYRSNDIEELNKLIHKTDKEKVIELGRNAKKTVAEKFSIDEFIDNWLDVLE